MTLLNKFSLEIQDWIKSLDYISFDTETISLDDLTLVGFSFAGLKDNEVVGYYVPLKHSGYNISLGQSKTSNMLFKDAYKLLNSILKVDNIVFHNYAFDSRVLAVYGLKPRNIPHDTLILSQLWDENISHRLKFLVSKYLGYEMLQYKDVCSVGGKRVSFKNVNPELGSKYGADDAIWTYKLFNYLYPRIEKDQKLFKLYSDIERPLVDVVRDIEISGIQIDIEKVAEIKLICNERCVELKKKIMDEIGYKINIDSSMQLKTYFIDKLHAPVVKVSESSQEPSMDKEVLQVYAETFPVAQWILDYRKYGKLLSTFIPALTPKKQDRIYPLFNQSATISGRFSSSNPNMQNIPIDDEFGIRDVILPDEDQILLDADYCLASGSKIFTRKGIKSIEAVGYGDEVVQEDGSFRKVIQKVNRGNSRIFLIETKLGYKISCTLNHRLRVIDSEGNYVWKRVKDIDINRDYLVIQPGLKFETKEKELNLPNIEFTHFNNRRDVVVPKKMSKDLSFYLGYLAGDGGIAPKSRGFRWVVNKHDEDLNRVMIILTKKLFHYNPQSKLISEKGIYSNVVTSKPLTKWLVSIGLSKGCVPEYLFDASGEVVGAWLRGFFEADGSVYKARVTCSSSRKLMIEQIKLLLLRLGIISSSKISKTKLRDKIFIGYHIDVKLGFSKLFRDRVGFESERKKKRLEKDIEISGTSPMYGNYPNLNNKVKTEKYYKFLANVRNRGDSVSRNAAIKLRDKDQDLYDNLGLYRIVEWGQVYDRVKHIKSVGFCQTFDLEIEDTHSFIVDGFVSHNSQIELRILAHFSKDATLTKAYQEGKDVHQATADACHCSRQDGKTINFGLMYRMAPKTLAKRLKISLVEAKAYTASYFNLYGGIEQFYRETIREAIDGGYIRTLYGRKRRLSGTYNNKARGLQYHEMSSIINSRIQGSSADIMKYAMVKMFEPLKVFGARMLLTVHDEVVISVPKKNLFVCSKIVEKVMIEVAPLFVPVEIDVRVGRTWGEAKHGLTPQKYLEEVD